MRTPFGNLTINQSTGQMIACLSNGIFFFFAFIVDSRTMVEYSYIIGAISLCLLGIIIVSYFLMSLNRLTAISLPFQYRWLFGKKAIRLMVSLNWGIPLAISAYLMILKECGFQFFHYGWTFSTIPNRELCGPSLRLYLTLSQMPVTVLTVICDILTFSMLVIGRHRIFKSKSAEMKRREMNFARQVLAQGAVSLVHSFWYNRGRDLIPGFSEEWRIFLTTSFSSNLLHVFDATVVFTCNFEFKDWLLKQKKKQTLVIVSTIRGRSQ
ncbi:hypothetical protein GCK72_019011 [Caenorhabditis remanei]|uniref:7TM GPCR serpentine receptor class x (Srx) domain-containing protein n=1 Tax=Caenorhabditis remanei TaxID=31234 RepID=A0A6A5GC67_CAERE|nr:hypothetical protein GCK72_019011 [Caenorhabditis remanei]KAF1752456.1 hypothetical protein GCK72_019011 [Caenorhabditis remanei]